MKEEWRDISGFPFYQVSNLGIVRSLDKAIRPPNGANKGFIKKGRVLKPKLDKPGYLRVGMMLNGNVKWESIHRLVAINFIQNPENKRTVNHIDGNKLNNKVDNLEWNTHLENVQHSIKSGTKAQAKGVQFINRTSFDELQVAVIKSLKGQLSNQKIANYFGVHRITISDILTGRSWKHVGLQF